jgi:hypothetical protein
MTKSKRKKKALPPRRKRMKRASRLQTARKWLESFQGKTPVRGYARWYGVDLLCAAKELQLLGVELDAGYLERLRVTAENRRCKRPSEAIEYDLVQTDEHFCFIAGYTFGGMPYGTPWSDDETTP